MAPHSPFFQIYSGLSTHAPLHALSFEPSLAHATSTPIVPSQPFNYYERNRRADDPAGLTPSLNSISNPTWTAPYLGIGLLNPTGTDGFDSVTEPSASGTSLPNLVHESESQHIPMSKALGLATMVILPFLWIIVVGACWFASRRRRGKTDFKLLSEKHAVVDSSTELPRHRFPRKVLQKLTIPYPQTVVQKPQPVHLVRKIKLDKPLPLKPNENSTARLPGKDSFFPLFLSSSHENACLSPALGGRSSPESDASTLPSCPPTPNSTYAEAPFVEVILNEEASTPGADTSRFTWDFKCVGGKRSPKLEKIPKPPSLPPLTFSNPLSELIKLIRGPPSPKQGPASPDYFSLSNAAASSSDEASSSTIQDNSTRSAISVTDSVSLEDLILITKAGGKPLVQKPSSKLIKLLVDVDPNSISNSILAPENEIQSGSKPSAPVSPDLALPARGKPENVNDITHNVIEDMKKSALQLSKPNHRVLTPSTPVLRVQQLIDLISDQPPPVTSRSEHSLSSSVSSCCSGDSSSDFGTSESMLADFPMCPALEGDGFSACTDSCIGMGQEKEGLSMLHASPPTQALIQLGSDLSVMGRRTPKNWG